MTYSFAQYFEWLLPWEGDYENDPNDPGGETRWGINKRDHPEVDIRRLTKEGAKAIYFSHYWKPSSADKLPPRTAWAIMDCAVNSGRVRAIQWMQELLGVAADGVIGPVTLRAAHAYGDAMLANRILARREKYYRSLATQTRFKRYLRGWLNRNNDLIRVLR